MATLHTARPDIASTVPARRAPVAGMLRTRSPAASMASATRMDFSTPIRRDSHEVPSPATAKHSKGIDGRIDATSAP